MSVFDDPRGKLQWLEEELLEEEWEEEQEEEDEEFEEEEEPRPLRRSRRRDFRGTVYADEETMADRQAIFVEKKKSRTGGLKFLAFLEILGILAIVWWWIKWLY